MNKIHRAFFLQNFPHTLIRHIVHASISWKHIECKRFALPFKEKYSCPGNPLRREIHHLWHPTKLQFGYYSSNDRQFLIYDLNGNLQHIVSFPKDVSNLFWISETELASHSKNMIELWNMSGTCTHSFSCKETILALDWHKDKKVIVCTESDIRLLDRHGKELSRYHPHASMLDDDLVVRLHPNGKRFVICNVKIEIWDIGDIKKVNLPTPFKHCNFKNAMWDKNGARLLTLALKDGVCNRYHCMVWFFEKENQIVIEDRTIYTRRIAAQIHPQLSMILGIKLDGSWQQHIKDCFIMSWKKRRKDQQFTPQTKTKIIHKDIIMLSNNTSLWSPNGSHFLMFSIHNKYFACYVCTPL